MAPVQVIFVKGTGPSSAAPLPGKTPRGGAGSRSPRGPGKTKERRPSRFPQQRSCGVVAERFGFANRDVNSRSPSFLKGIRSFVVPADYEPPGVSARLFAVTRRAPM